MRIYLIFLVQIIFLSCTTRKEHNSLTDDNLTGDVVSCSITKYETVEKFGELTSGSIIDKQTNKYDNAGSKIETIVFMKDGSIAHRHLFQYDTKKYVIEQSTYSSDGSLFRKTTSRNKYDEEGYLIEVTSPPLKWINKYDKKGNKTESLSYNLDGSLFEKSVFTYDRDGRKIKSVSFNAEGKSLSDIVFRYDNKGNLSEDISYAEDGSVYVKYSYKYDKFDEKNNWTKRIIIRSPVSYETVNREVKTIEEREIGYNEY